MNENLLFSFWRMQVVFIAIVLQISYLNDSVEVLNYQIKVMHYFL